MPLGPNAGATTAGQHSIKFTIDSTDSVPWETSDADNVSTQLIHINTDLTVPTAPSNLTGSSTSPSGMDLTWTDNSDNEDGFRVYRWDGAQFALIATTLANVTGYNDNDQTTDTVTASWVGTITSSGRKARGAITALPGDFEADLTLSGAGAPKSMAVNKATITGTLANSVWNVDGHLGTLTMGAMKDSRVALGEGAPTKYDLKSLTITGSKNDANGPAFVQSQVVLTGKLGSAKLNLVNIVAEINNPSASRFLGLQADTMSLVSFRAAGVNSGKAVTFTKLEMTADLSDAKKHTPKDLDLATLNTLKLKLV